MIRFHAHPRLAYELHRLSLPELDRAERQLLRLGGEAAAVWNAVVDERLYRLSRITAWRKGWRP